MRARVIPIVLLLLTVAVLCALLFGFDRSTYLSGLMTDEEAFAALRQSRTENPALDLTLRSGDAVVPCAGNVWYCSVRAGQPDPLLQSGEGLKLAFLHAELDADFLAAGAGLPFLAYNDTEYRVGTLQLTTLPLITVQVREPDASGSYDVLDRTERTADLTLYDNREDARAGQSVLCSEATIRVRGNTSAALEKKSYRVSLTQRSPGDNARTNPRSLLGMREDDDWILYASAGDPEHVRNTFCSNLWYESCAEDNALGKTLGVEGRYVELLLNGEYMGLYTLTYPLDEKQLGLSAEDFYYRGESYAATSSELLQGADPAATTVGGWSFRGAKDNPATGYARWKPLDDYLNLMWRYDKLEGLLGTQLDADNVADLYLFLSFCIGRDNYSKNNNVIACVQPDGGYLYLFAPWDLDLTFGNGFSETEAWRTLPYTEGYDALYEPKQLLVPQLLERSERYRAFLWQKWNDLRAGSWSDAEISLRIDDCESALFASGAMAREAARWPTEPNAADLAQFRSFVLARLHWLDGWYAEVTAQ